MHACFLAAGGGGDGCGGVAAGLVFPPHPIGGQYRTRIMRLPVPGSLAICGQAERMAAGMGVVGGR